MLVWNLILKLLCAWVMIDIPKSENSAKVSVTSPEYLNWQMVMAKTCAMFVIFLLGDYVDAKLKW